MFFKKMSFNKRQRQFLLVAPAIFWLFLCMIFNSLGGGRGNAKDSVAQSLGINPELPKAKPDPKQAFLDKLKLYEKAERDSVQKKQYQRQDPYGLDTTIASGRDTGIKLASSRATLLLEQLGRLKQGLQRQLPSSASSPAPDPMPMIRRSYAPAPSEFRGHDDTSGDSRMGRINVLLDKVIRIQHPEEGHKPLVLDQHLDEVAPADSNANTIAASIPDDQTLTSGTTIALRTTDSMRIDGRVLPGGQLVYGLVSINNDRMYVHITSMRQERRLFNIDMQVYDMDGIAGIHIPAVLSRDVAKQSADQGVNSLNVMTMDPNVAAQVATAGVQTVKAFVGRKVRQVRVTVRAGYQVLLKNTRNSTDRVFTGSSKLDVELRPPGFVPGGPILSHCREEGVELALQGVWLEHDVLWLGLEIANRAAIDYIPAYARWYIRDRRRFRRAAMQDLPLEPVYMAPLVTIAGDSTFRGWTGFTPFAIGKDKELVLEIGEKGGGRVLALRLDDRQLLRAKTIAP